MGANVSATCLLHAGCRLRTASMAASQATLMPPLPAVHEEYLVPPAQYSFALQLTPLAPGGVGGSAAVAERATAEWRALL